MGTIETSLSKSIADAFRADRRLAASLAAVRRWTAEISARVLQFQNDRETIRRRLPVRVPPKPWRDRIHPPPPPAPASTPSRKPADPDPWPWIP